MQSPFWSLITPRITDKPPTSSSKKDGMKAWLLERNIQLCDVLKARLFDLIELNESKHVIDRILADEGRPVLRLPDLNPIELVRQWVASKNGKSKIKDVERLRRQRFEEIGREECGETRTDLF
ncbi:hypothetical protein L798_07326 [Zootermopsis nevadensis]|uniref:Uncharacterized protein n=1 Tax=Zootermopsis nevadensis TaxID=136037 RepID=A0A067R670_ZOONE|nr:hypothetical protein L798_07326 [Zootermopsis nevadensis]